MKPGVPAGTRIVEISLPPPGFSPVTAATVTNAVMDVPLLVMNALVPLMTHSSPSSTAVVRVAPASVPPPGSVSPKAPSASPDGQPRQPLGALGVGAEAQQIGIAPSETAASRVIARLESTRASSSIATHSAT